MASLPWFLYGLTPRDQGMPSFRLFFKHDLVLGASTGLIKEYRIPLEYLFIWNVWSLEANAGGAQQILSGGVNVYPPGTPSGGGVPLQALFTETIPTPQGVVTTGAICETMDGLILAPDTLLIFECLFSSGALLNTVQFSLGGVLIPKGNVQVV